MDFLEVYDMDISSAVSASSNMMASLAALQTFHRAKNEEVTSHSRCRWFQHRGVDSNNVALTLFCLHGSTVKICN